MLLKYFMLLFAATALPVGAAAEEGPADMAPVEVMVLGSFHFSNPGADVVNMDIDDVLAPKRQREIDVLTRTLAQWKPTRIVVEAQAAAPGFSLPDYAKTEELLKTDRGEDVQIGYRMARILGHKAVYGLDERPAADEPDYFPMGKVMAFAETNGQSELIASLIGEVEEQTARQQDQLRHQSLAEALTEHNDTAKVSAMHDRLYYSLIKVGDGNAQPGAELNAYWYMRNAKMFGKLDMIAQPGDRILVIVGSGHATWLKHFTSRMPGYVSVEPMPYLLGAAAASAMAD